MSADGPDELYVSHRITMARGELSPLAHRVAAVFGIDLYQGHRTLFDRLPVPTSGITLVTGFSGSGKSTLLARIAELRPEARWSETSAPDEGSVVDLFDGDLPKIIHWLGKFGLAEARVLLAPPARLSEGQKHRLSLARALWSRPRVVLVDEFLSSLDRITAQVVAHSFQKICRAEGITAYLATAHHDIASSLRPDHVLRLDLDSAVVASETPWDAGDRCPLERELVEGPGSVADYETLAAYHYRDTDDAWIDWDDLVREVRVVRHQDRPIAVKVFSRPFSRRLERMPLFRELNERAIMQERVIVHPAFRGLSLNRWMQPTHTDGARAVFAQSALGRFFPYNLKAGFEAVAHPSLEPTPAQRELAAAVAELAGERDAFNAHSPDALDALLRELDPDRARAVCAVAARAFVDVSLQQVLFVAGLCDRPPTPAEHRAVESFLRSVAEKTPTENAGKLVEVGMPFPMQAFVRWLP